jgi:hypothetical protein
MKLAPTLIRQARAFAMFEIVRACRLVGKELATQGREHFMGGF